LHWKTILFIEANAITGHSTCFGHRIFRVPTRQCPAHRAKETVALLTTEIPDFIPPTLWPPNSLDLNPVEYCVWNVLQDRVYSVSQKKSPPPYSFLNFFPKRLGIFNQIFTHLLYDHIYTRVQIFIQMSPNFDKVMLY